MISVLVVDDDAGVRDLMVKVMQEEGYQVQAAADGAEALAAARRSAPKVVLLDLRLPGQSGWTVFRELRRLIPALSIVVVTAETHQSETARAAGASAFFEKPLDFPSLLRAIRALTLEPTATL